MITRQEWALLKPGDVLRWEYPDGTYILRTVMDKGYRCVVFPIRNRSWTRRIHTAYSFSDIAHRCSIHHEPEERLMTSSELLRLCDIGFNIPSELHRERGEYGCLKAVPTTKMMGAAAVARKFCTQ